MSLSATDTPTAPTPWRTGHGAHEPARSGRRASERDLTGRGSTTVPARVVSRIAEQAATEVPHIGAPAGGVLGVGSRRDVTARPHAECDLYGRAAVLRLELGVDFPQPLAATLAELRRHVSARVEQLTGFEVSRLDVTISWLHSGDAAGRVLR